MLNTILPESDSILHIYYKKCEISYKYCEILPLNSSISTVCLNRLGYRPDKVLRYENISDRTLTFIDHPTGEAIFYTKELGSLEDYAIDLTNCTFDVFCGELLSSYIYRDGNFYLGDQIDTGFREKVEDLGSRIFTRSRNGIRWLNRTGQSAIRHMSRLLSKRGVSHV